MKLQKELPEIFETFGEIRRNSFITAKEQKEKDIPLIGVFCTYFPQEIALAMGASTVSLCASSDETIPDAEQDLPRNLCPLIKSSYGFGKTDKCPFFYFSDLVVGETTCDGKKKMYEYLSEFKPVHVMELPNSQSEDGFKLWKNEIIKLKNTLEKQFNVSISEENIRKAIKIKNNERKALKEFYELGKLDPVPVTGTDIFKVLNGTTFAFDKEAIPKQLNELVDKIKTEYKNTKKYKSKPRILITGCPLGTATEKVIKAIEDNGAYVVAFENCSGAKAVEDLVDEDNSDIYDALAKKYLSIGCSCMTPNPNRIKLLDKMIDEYKVDAVVDVILTACHTYNVETLSIKRFVNTKKDIPYMSMETDFSNSDIGQLNTRMAAFIEML
ncbi:MAG: double-cubane-cluster-containing anaerobic reductase [Clostridium sp.]|jgi:benzoyl-CoA reductase/2-hydroxyglutaryl-CoA dehydratase subunit BcrC/BadD/HgdB|uniref:2-hydroxyacyl-CoA dehydratase family protein n=1 Tax=Clostridium tertium TaxID=1559 RepID=A0A9X3XKF4_9CLOT|nr:MULTISPECIES: double-cubane-cluster-containing anaerobic reductase [Clostridium]MBU6135269.1 2-hydroxyacyl-CoA dehydratase family protein [Clostridium tertium]MDB1940294.1 double-cubane-cluster-containing anaerobic reductase [Clostridium tertium]MDB1947582.1 double-cubane-cluster-containing anaerobic reductase [Clostridium tertium]MDB1956561.1 double-cubane-cluster-containing anaerobic reductase [Clostridium tertium]MDB1959866.1 double-cubane-cluster-containing anaerobic reductase [Clostrid